MIDIIQPILIPSKAGAEELVVAFENTYGIPSLITHTMNVLEKGKSENSFQWLLRKLGIMN